MKKYIKELILFLIAFMAVCIVFLPIISEKEKKYEHDIVFLGDSVIGNHADPFGVTTVMEDRLGLNVFNGALGGTSMSFFNDGIWESVAVGQWSMVKLAQAICADDWTSQLAGVAYSEQHREETAQVLDYFYERVHHLSQIDFSKVDILLIEHGTNDYNCGRQLDNPTDPFDISTYGGALRTALSLLQKKYPDLRIILLSPVYCEFMDMDNAKCYEVDFGGGILEEYVLMQKAVAEEFDIEWVDMYHDSGIWSDTISIYAYDRLHLTAEGQQLIGDFISDYLEENPMKPTE